jgi:GNAT superfamily N-acetyltransferase
VPEDADAVAALLRRSKAEAMPWLAVVHTPDEDRAWVAGVLLVEHRVAVVDAPDGLVGVAAVRPGWLDQLYVRTSDQGRGVGRQLLRWAQATSPEGLQLWAFARNAPARRFYERAGFVLVRSTDGRGNEEREPDVLYAWTPDR